MSVFYLVAVLGVWYFSGVNFYQCETADLPTKQALGLLVIEPNVELGSKVGIQATSLKAEISCELILASSVIPPDLESGPTGSTLHKINSLQNACNKN